MRQAVFPCKLCHVTSMFFLPYIRAHGLAGYDGIAHWRMLETLRFLEPKAAAVFTSDEWWLREKGAVSLICNQENNTPRIFTRGQTIVCASDRQALDKAALYPCECETLDYLIEIYRRLKKAEDSIHFPGFPVLDALDSADTCLKPVMIVIDDCPIDCLVPEREANGVTTEMLADRARKTR